MLKYSIKLQSLADAELLFQAANRCSNFPVTLVSGSYLIDAKSFLGVFSLVNRTPLTLQMNATEDILQPFLQEINPLLCTYTPVP